MLRVLLLPERAFAARERALLERLSVGLADEGARVLQGVPGVGLDADDLRTERLGVFATPVPFADAGLPWTEPLRAKVMLEGVSRAMAGNRMAAPGVDVVHALGVSTWEFARHAAQQARATLVVEVYSRACVERAVGVGGKWNANTWWNAADPALAVELTRRLGNGAQRVVSNAWGVHVPDRPHAEIRLNRAATVVLWCGSGVIPVVGVEAVMAGLAGRAKSERGILILAHDVTAEKLKLWKIARKLDIAHCLSIVPELTERWDVTLEADALVIPAAAGEQSGFVLEAMAAGMPVIARADDAASHLVDQETAVLVRPPADKADAWGAAIASVLDRPERAIALGSEARHFVREKRLASAWVAGVMRLYETASRRAGGEVGVR